MPWLASRSLFGVRHWERPARVAHCCWSVMICRMLGWRVCAAADCDAAAVAAASDKKSRRLTFTPACRWGPVVSIAMRLAGFPISRIRSVLAASIHPLPEESVGRQHTLLAWPEILADI